MDKIVFFEIETWEQEFVQQVLSSYPLIFTAQKVQDETNPAIFDAKIISTFIYSTLNEDALSKFPNLKLIATRSTGYDHIDLSYCKKKGITVMNVPSYGAHTVAQHTFALILALSRNLIPTVERSRRGNFSLDGLRGFDLSGKTLGIIGCGKIGKKVMQLALAFDMQVQIFTRHPENSTHSSYRFVPLQDLIQSSDIVSLHVPYTPQTHHLINRGNIKQFKKGSILINTARGPLVETQAILDGLETKILKAVGLDVLEEECSLREERELLTDDFLKTCDLKTQLLNHVLLNRDDVIFTSHNAFNSNEALKQILDITMLNIHSYFDNSPQNSLT